MGCVFFSVQLLTTFPANPLLASDLFSSSHPPFTQTLLFIILTRTFQRPNNHTTDQTTMTVTLMVLILSNFYMVKPEEDQYQAVDEFGIPREPLLIPGMPLLNNAAQLLEWTASCINEFHALWRDVIFWKAKGCWQPIQITSNHSITATPPHLSICKATTTEKQQHQQQQTYRRPMPLPYSPQLQVGTPLEFLWSVSD